MNILEQLASNKAPPARERWPASPTSELCTLVIAPPRSEPHLACLVRRTYTLNGGRLSLSDVQAPLLTTALSRTDPRTGEVYLWEDSDVHAPKPATDVILTGSAYSRSPTPELMVSAALGGSARQLRVIGPRIADVGRDGSVTFSEPAPFEETELTPLLAYGGGDLHAQNQTERRGGVLLGDLPDKERPTRAQWLYSYPRNPVGLGYFIDKDRGRATGAMLPRIEDPADPLTPERLFVSSPRAWLAAPTPGLLGWIGPDWHPRCARVIGHYLAHDPAIGPDREAAFPDGADLSEIRRAPRLGFSSRGLQGAAPGLAVERLRGDEVGLLTNLRPNEASVRFQLPGEAPEIRVTPPGLGEMRPAPVLQTVRIDTTSGQISLTWCATVRLLTRVPVSFLRACRLQVSYKKV
ncbi:MAG: DUF2169 domain-containing protein [Polyangiaceae bacterium]